MNGQRFGEHFYVSDDLERIDLGAGGPIVAAEPSVEPVPVLANLVEQTPVGAGTITPVAHTDEMIVQEAPRGETIVYKDSVGETFSHEDPTDEMLPHIDPLSEPIAPEIPAAVHDGAPAALLDSNESEHLRTRWNEIQGNFVDEPRSAVQQADALVSEVVEKITQMFASEHSTLEEQWKQGQDVSTEDLRQALQHYRAFFNRLVMQTPN